nr:hypothetical protein [Kluyvera ascorbata]
MSKSASDSSTASKAVRSTVSRANLANMSGQDMSSAIAARSNAMAQNHASLAANAQSIADAKSTVSSAMDNKAALAAAAPVSQQRTPPTPHVVGTSLKNMQMAVTAASPVSPSLTPTAPITHKGGSDRGTRSRSERSTGNGASNAQNSRSASGLADSHVGGGRSGGGFHY